MKKLIAIFTLCFSLTSFSSSSDHAQHEMKEKKGKEDHSAHKSKEGKIVTLSGTLIGLTCFIKHGSKGSKHKSCAKDCAEKGLPIGLMSDGVIYQISGEGHASLKEAYAPLLKYIENEVKVMGTLFEKNGLKFLVIQKIKKS